ncbi:hypothetical protein [Isoptericola dokdonensis]|jgi:hypothetical protein|uniref:SPOR domain-containing protein n=1 Tax=Isoptericola dokdonensis DS-3 TaxID=1300344 RepID=A0A168EDZ5_9MICO|nr:hypothetical protein [Isoptericola dokdonensis]ANC29923.1 hypothetical protein I598_0335 [Isoptericola dokdonensis DS-3]
MSEENSTTQYWFNTKTGQVETSGEKSSWTHLMGPYPTREEAAQALDTASRRTEDWETEDEEWRRG